MLIRTEALLGAKERDRFGLELKGRQGRDFVYSVPESLSLEELKLLIGDFERLESKPKVQQKKQKLKLPDIDYIYDLLLCLSNPSVLKALLLIRDKRDAYGAWLAEKVGLAQPTMAIWLGRLHSLGLLRKKKKGTLNCRVYYRLTEKGALLLQHLCKLVIHS